MIIQRNWVQPIHRHFLINTDVPCWCVHNICMKHQYIQVFVSCESRWQAKKLVDSLLNDQIIACAQILPKVESFYRWQGQIESAVECLVLMKTMANQFSLLEQEINKLHSYETPEIIAVPLVDGSTEYLNWINEQIKPQD